MGGQVIMSVPNRYNVFSEPSHIQFFTDRDVCRLFEGFKTVTCRVIPSGHIFGVFKVTK